MSINRFSKPALQNLAKLMKSEQTHKYAVFLICNQLRKNSVYLEGELVHTQFNEPLEGIIMLSYVIDKIIFTSLGNSDPTEFAFDINSLVETYSYLFELELTNSSAMSSALEG